MRKKKPEQIKEVELHVGSRVLTPISERYGEIISIAEKRKEYAFGADLVYDGDTPQSSFYKLYTVKIPFPRLKEASFINATVVLERNELTTSMTEVVAKL